MNLVLYQSTKIIYSKLGSPAWHNNHNDLLIGLVKTHILPFWSLPISLQLPNGFLSKGVTTSSLPTSKIAFCLLVNNLLGASGSSPL